MSKRFKSNYISPQDIFPTDIWVYLLKYVIVDSRDIATYRLVCAFLNLLVGRVQPYVDIWRSHVLYFDDFLKLKEYIPVENITKQPSWKSILSKYLYYKRGLNMKKEQNVSTVAELEARYTFGSTGECWYSYYDCDTMTLYMYADSYDAGYDISTVAKHYDTKYYTLVTQDQTLGCLKYGYGTNEHPSRNGQCCNFGLHRGTIHVLVFNFDTDPKKLKLPTHKPSLYLRKTSPFDTVYYKYSQVFNQHTNDFKRSFPYLHVSLYDGVTGRALGVPNVIMSLDEDTTALGLRCKFGTLRGICVEDRTKKKPSYARTPGLGVLEPGDNLLDYKDYDSLIRVYLK